MRAFAKAIDVSERNHSGFSAEKTLILPHFIAVVACGLFLTSAGCHWGSNRKNVVGTQLHQQGHYTAAMQQFQQAVAEDPTNPDGYYNLAATMHRLAKDRQDPKMMDDALNLYQQCLDLSPNHVECHRGLAVLLIDTGKPDRAFALVKNWATRVPNAADPRIELARLYEETGDAGTALQHLESAVQLDANNSRAWLALGRIRESSGDDAQALQNYQRALALNGGQTAVAERVAVLNRRLNSQMDASLNANNVMIAQPPPSPVVGRTQF